MSQTNKMLALANESSDAPPLGTIELSTFRRKEQNAANAKFVSRRRFSVCLDVGDVGIQSRYKGVLHLIDDMMKLGWSTGEKRRAGRRTHG